MAPGTSTCSNGPVPNAQDNTPARPTVPPAAPAAAAGPASSQASGNMLPPPGPPYAQAYLGLTREQIDARFGLEQRKVEADLAAIEARTIRENEESRARIVTIRSGAVTAAAPRNRVDEETPVGEISRAARLVVSKYPGLQRPKLPGSLSTNFDPKISTNSGT